LGKHSVRRRKLRMGPSGSGKLQDKVPLECRSPSKRRRTKAGAAWDNRGRLSGKKGNGFGEKKGTGANGKRWIHSEGNDNHIDYRERRAGLGKGEQHWILARMVVSKDESHDLFLKGGKRVVRSEKVFGGRVVKGDLQSALPVAKMVHAKKKITTRK